MAKQFILWRIADERGYTVDRLARESGVNFHTVQNLMRKRTKDPTGSTLIPIAQVLGLHVEDLYEDIPEGTSEQEESATPSGAHRAA